MIVNWISRKGGRAVNEDYVGSTREKGILCVAVADGLGGNGGGEIASKLTVDSILSSFKKEPVFSEEQLKKYIDNAKSSVSRKALSDPELLHMASTVAVIMIKGKRAICATVGDTRIYKFSNGDISEVSEDHSLAFMDFMRGKIEYDEIRTSENQNILTSAVGIDMDRVNFSHSSGINSSVAFLICSDCWWKYVTEDDMETTIKASGNAREWLERMAKIRDDKAPENSDNYTAAVIMI